MCDGEPGGGIEALVSSLLDKSSLHGRIPAGTRSPGSGCSLVREFAAERAAEDEDLALEQWRSLLPALLRARREARQRADRRQWLDRLAQERGNIRLAFERLLRAGATDEALRVAIAFMAALPWDAHAHEVRVARAGARRAGRS